MTREGAGAHDSSLKQAAASGPLARDDRTGVLIDVDHAIVSVAVDPSHLWAAFQEGEHGLHVALNLEVHRPAVGVHLVAGRSVTVVVRVQGGGGNERHRTEPGLHLLKNSPQTRRKTFSGSFGARDG